MRKLRHRAMLQRRVETPSDDDTAIVYRTVDTLNIDVITRSGQEFVEARKLNAKLTHLVETRYDSRVLPSMRLVWGAVVLNILAAYDPDQMRQRTLIECEEVVL